MSEHRPLRPAEIAALEAGGCSADSWDGVHVAVGFDPARCVRARFLGRVRLGCFRAVAEVDGLAVPAGVRDATVRDCEIGDDAAVHEVGLLAGYRLEREAVLDSVRRMVVEGESAFGNGTTVEVLSEAGGRRLAICDRLSSPAAHLLAFHRHDPTLVEALAGLVAEHAATRRSTAGLVGAGARVTGAGTLRNVRIGPGAVIRGALALEEGTVDSRPGAPTLVGEGVVARNFIILPGARVDGGAVITNALVGEIARVGRGFSMEHCAVFTGAEAFHGEACSVLAAPFSVSHHRATLLIGAACSFLNAGSGTNMSNHMYRLGPVHAGVLERGCKTGSGSHLVWPGRVGPYSVVVGRHRQGLDTADLPFSLVLEEAGGSVVRPGATIGRVGPRRDARKWPERDRRGAGGLDPVIVELFGPFVLGRVERGLAFLGSLAASAGGQDARLPCGARIPAEAVTTGMELYGLALDAWLGANLAGVLEAPAFPGSRAELAARLGARRPEALGDWLDLGGLIVSKAALEPLLDDLRQGRVAGLEELNGRLHGLRDAYGDLAAAWGLDALGRRLGAAPERLGVDRLHAVIAAWREAALRLSSLARADAAKEFGPAARVGFGLDGGQEERDRDFEAVRGRLEDDRFVKLLAEEDAGVERRAAELLRRLDGLS